MDDGTVEWLIRHKPDSTASETTYAHLSDVDFIEKAERAFGMSDDDGEEEFMDRIPEELREEFFDGQDGDDLLSTYLRDSLVYNVVVAISDQLAHGLDSKLAVQGEDPDDAVGGAPEDA